MGSFLQPDPISAQQLLLTTPVGLVRDSADPMSSGWEEIYQLSTNQLPHQQLAEVAFGGLGADILHSGNWSQAGVEKRSSAFRQLASSVCSVHDF